MKAYLRTKILWVQENRAMPIAQATLGIAYAVNGLWEQRGISFRNATTTRSRQTTGAHVRRHRHSRTGELSESVLCFVN